jgi:hypothetical protein
VRKLTIKDMRELAEKKGGKCLSGIYIGSQSKLSWECEKGHTWESRPNCIGQGRWCPTCANRKRARTIEQMQEIAKSRGGKCLSMIFIDSHTKLLWECTKGHTWETTFDIIRKGHWCSVCAGNKKQTIEQLQKLAETRGGKLLSSEYKRQDIKLLWECIEGHRWRALAKSVKEGYWCRQCYLGNRFGYSKKGYTIYKKHFE